MWLTTHNWGPARESWQRERRSENILRVHAHHSCGHTKWCLIFSGVAVREFRQRTDGLQVLLSQAVLFGYPETVEAAVQLSNSCFSQFKEGSQKFGAEVEGIHLISNYKGVNRIHYGVWRFLELAFIFVSYWQPLMKYRGHTHLMVALEEGRTEIAKSLLQHGVFILPELVLISYPVISMATYHVQSWSQSLFSGSTGVDSSAHCMQKWRDRHDRAHNPGCREAGHDSDFSFWEIRQVSSQHADTPQHGRTWGRTSQ